MKALTHLIVFVVLATFTGCFPQRGDEVSLVSVSPDGAHRLELVEHAGRLDRNFYLRLHRVQDNAVTNVFDSPDEGKPIGTERIVWSRDSSRFVLLGRHFVVESAAMLTNGESLYLLYDIRSNEIRCNASQQNRYPNFSLEDLKGVEWSGGF